jgi:hypothetical protein
MLAVSAPDDATRHATRRRVGAAQASFTRTRHETTLSIFQTPVTATTSLGAVVTAADAASRTVLTCLITPARN